MLNPHSCHQREHAGTKTQLKKIFQFLTGGASQLVQVMLRIY